MIHAKDIKAARNNLGAPWQSGFTTLRWIERPEDVGLTFVGNVDATLRSNGRRSDHTGWFLDDDGIGGTVTGVVYALPHRRGFLAGVNDSWNGRKDGSGPASLATCEIYEDEVEAARAADHIAEVYAENERDYQRASSARVQYDTLADDISATRKNALALIREIKAAKANLCGFESIIATLRGKLASYRRSIDEMRSTREELHRDFAREKGWTDNDAAPVAA